MEKPISRLKRIAAMLVAAALLTAVFPHIPAMANDDSYDLPWLWPVPGSFMINCLDYYYSGGIHNQGQCIDIGANGYTGAERLDVVSATTGTVLYIQSKYNETTNRGSGWGNYVLVRSGNINIIYAHLRTVSVGYGEIKAGEVIGKMGNTGNSTGVHLHLQAYPVGGNSSSTEIMAFEQYRTNPLYYEQFRFLTGLAEMSVKYGGWIKTYYRTAAGAYYKYSGGLDIGFGTVPAQATVSVINTSGAPVRSLPVPDNSYITDTVSFGKKAGIKGYLFDAYGTLWLELSDGSGWIKGEDVGFYDYLFSVDTENAVYPDGEYGSSRELPFGGTVSSLNIITSCTVTVKQGGSTVAAVTKEVGDSSFLLSDIKALMTDLSLPDGEYGLSVTCLLTATYPGADPMTETEEIISSRFTINSEISDKVPPVLERIDVISLNPSGMTVKCIAGDNKAMFRVVVAVTGSDGRVVKEYICTEDNGAWHCVIPASEIGGGGSYTLTATAYDAYGNTDSAARTVTVPASGLSEVWRALDALKIRRGPDVTYKHIGAIKKGESFTITAAQADDSKSYFWAEHSKGWSPLGTCGGSMYAKYVSGHLYTVTFDINGGTGEAPAAIDKRWNENVTLPSDIPVREGYTFLGWAHSTEAKSPDYRPGDTYKENTSDALFAVWEDKIPPVISSADVSATGWTNKPVTVTVAASDNGGRVFYSFDGGKTWRPEGKLEVPENTVIPAGAIIVRDQSGNTAVWDKEIKIGNIDLTPPDMGSAKAEIKTSGKSVTFTFYGITDSDSGIASHEIVYSQNRDMSDPKMLAVASGTAVTLDNGVYYWLLRVTDKAGNVSEKSFDRFRVGETERLTAPAGLRIDSTSSVSTAVSWEAVPEADSYRISVSEDPAFVSDITAVSEENTHIITGLTAGKTYYVRVAALSDDGIYLPSAYCAAVSFVTLSNDCTLHGFVSMSGAAINNEEKTASWVAPYAAKTVDLTASVHPGATVVYSSSADLSVKLNGTSAYPFTSASATVYIGITAENGDAAVYTVTIKRAAEKAALPAVDFIAEDTEINIGDSAPEFALTAVSPDGGVISVTWFMTVNGGSPVKIGEGFSVTPELPVAGDYAVYAVVTNTNDKCAETVAAFTTDRVSVTVKKLVSPITVTCSGYTYNGKTPSPAVSGYTGDGRITFRYFSDSGCVKEIPAPTDAGTYYVRAEAAETVMYAPVVSAPVSFTVARAENKAMPEYTVKQPTVRDANGYVTITSAGTEYRVNGQDKWTAAGSSPIAFRGGDEVEIRIAGTVNYLPGAAVTVVIKAYEGATDIVPGSTGLSVDGEYLTVDGSKNTASDILDGLENSGGVVIRSEQGIVMNGTDDYVGTGATIAVEDEDGNVYVSLTVIVLGDMDGDGIVTRADAEAIMLISNGMAPADGKFDLVAGDLDRDGKLTSKDAYLALMRS